MKLTVTRGVAENSNDRRQHHPAQEHHHAEHAGQRRGEPAAGVADLFQVRRGPHADGELGEDAIDDVQPRHEDVAVAKVSERELRRAAVIPGHGDRPSHSRRGRRR